MTARTHRSFAACRCN